MGNEMAKAARRTTREVPARTHPAIAAAPRARQTIDVGGLERALRKAVAGEVRFDSASLGLYAQDASNFRQVPVGVVVPRTLDDVVAVHKVCHRFGARSSAAAAAPASPARRSTKPSSSTTPSTSPASGRSTPAAAW